MATIVTEATGRAHEEPDRAELNVGIESQSGDPEAARAETAAGADSVREALRDVGVPESAVRTSSFDVRRRRRRPEREVDDPEYQATYTYQVELDDVDALGGVVDAAVGAGATGIDRVRFTFSEERRRELRSAALDDAMASARDRAEVVAASEGLSIAGVEEVETRETGGGGPPGREVHVDTAESGAAPATFEAGTVAVTETVEVSYAAE